jgi:hypothetical protein
MNLPLMKSGEDGRLLTVFAGFIRKGGLALPPRKQPVRSPSARPDGFAHSVSGIVDSVGKGLVGPWSPVFLFDQVLKFSDEDHEGRRSGLILVHVLARRGWQIVIFEKLGKLGDPFIPRVYPIRY